MKKIFASAVFLAVAMFILGSGASQAKADTTSLDSSAITPSEAVALNQELESMKSVLLQMKAAYATPVPETIPAPVAFSREELNTLSESLIGIKSEIISLSQKVDSNGMSSDGIATLQSALSGLSDGLLAIKENIAEAPASRPVSDIAKNENLPLSASFPNNAKVTAQENPNKETEVSNGGNKALAESSLGLKNLSKPAFIGTAIGIVILGIGVWIWRKKADSEEIPKTQL